MVTPEGRIKHSERLINKLIVLTVFRDKTLRGATERLPTLQCGCVGRGWVATVGERRVHERARAEEVINYVRAKQAVE